MTQMVGEGVRNVREMERCIRYFVSHDLFKGSLYNIYIYLLGSIYNIYMTRVRIPLATETKSVSKVFVSLNIYTYMQFIFCLYLFSIIATTPHKNIETNSRFTTKIDISSHMESLNFQSGNDETA